MSTMEKYYFVLAVVIVSTVQCVCVLVWLPNGTLCTLCTGGKIWFMFVIYFDLWTHFSPTASDCVWGGAWLFHRRDDGIRERAYFKFKRFYAFVNSWQSTHIFIPFSIWMLVEWHKKKGSFIYFRISSEQRQKKNRKWTRKNKIFEEIPNENK